MNKKEKRMKTFTSHFDDSEVKSHRNEEIFDFRTECCVQSHLWLLQLTFHLQISVHLPRHSLDTQTGNSSKKLLQLNCTAKRVTQCSNPTQKLPTRFSRSELSLFKFVWLMFCCSCLSCLQKSKKNVKLFQTKFFLSLFAIYILVKLQINSILMYFSFFPFTLNAGNV